MDQARYASRDTSYANWLLACLSGVLSCLPFRIFSTYPLIFVALVPLLVALRGASWRSRFVLGSLTGGVGIASAFYWVLPAIARFENISLLLALPFFALFVAYHALQLSLFSIIAPAPGSRSGTFTGPACVASVWVLLEYFFPKIIPWSFGSVIAESAWLRQGADLAGVYGLSFLVVFVNAALAHALTNRDERPAIRLRPIAAAAGFVLLALAYGALSLRSSSTGAESTLSIAVLQGGLHSGRTDLEAANAEAWERYAALTETFADHRGRSTATADLVVWPETVLRVYLRGDGSYRKRVEDLVMRQHGPLLVGALDLPEHGDGELNSAYLFAAPGTASAPSLMQVYHKNYLLPFGEYVPGAEVLRFLRTWKTTGQFVSGGTPLPLTLAVSRSRGEGSVVHVAARFRESSNTAETVRFAPSICFEAIQPGWFNPMVRDGAGFLVNITDDGWFGDSAAPQQHLQLMRLRAVETRRWLVRASNSGISAFIDPSGEVVASLPFGAVGMLEHEIAPRPTASPYVRLGNWPISLCTLIVLLHFRHRVRRPRMQRSA